uniref:Uncharacterized protein n=1 Tax=Escherichia coli TaxID=562 RepID=H1ZY02_ECOLX|nr:hypothetical protein MM3_076 [Escherichia coli]
MLRWRQPSIKWWISWCSSIFQTKENPHEAGNLNIRGINARVA